MTNKEANRILLFSLLHLPVGWFLYSSGTLAIVHPIAIFFVGVYWAVNRNIKLGRIACLAAYLVGCEVLWRMAETPVFWEYGKYASSTIMIIALIVRGHYLPPALPTVFISLLLPACVLTLGENDLSVARAQISFNLSGPFLLFVSCWFFSYIRFSHTEIKNLLVSIFIPLLTVAATTLFYTVSKSEEIQFNTESNFQTSGGFGPNQVSSMLGLGVFIGMTVYLLFRLNFRFKLYFVIGTIFLAAQSVLTFSRGGIYNAIGAMAILVFFQMQRGLDSIKRIIPIILIIVIFLALIFPFIDDFTGGKLQERFRDTGTTNRLEIAESDFQILRESPLLGVGLGNAKAYREKILGYSAASHTEFTRLISEHGVFGLLAIICLLLMVISNLLRRTSIFGRALLAGIVIWSCLYMLNAGMRLAAPAFLLGFTFVNLIEFQPKLGRTPSIRRKSWETRKKAA